MTPDPWEILGLARDASLRDVKRRYAQLLKTTRPDDDPDGFARLRWAYEACAAQLTADPAPVRDAPIPYDETPAPDTPVAPRASAVSLTSLGLDRLDALREPHVVVNELLEQASLDHGDGGSFAAWFVRCPELAALSMRSTVEQCLLLRFANTNATVGSAAFLTLHESFGWSQIGLERRLLTDGMHPHDVRRALKKLDTMLIDAQFEHHLASTTRLCAPGNSIVLGDPVAENALLQRLHATRSKRPGLLRALRPQTVRDAVELVRAYRLRYGNSAVDRLFGVGAMAFWNTLYPNAPPNAPQIVLRVVRLLLATITALTLISLVAFRGPGLEPISVDTKITWWIWGITGALALAAVGTAWRWFRTVGLLRWKAHRERSDREPFLDVRQGMFVFVLIVPAIVRVAGLFGTAWTGVLAARAARRRGVDDRRCGSRCAHGARSGARGDGDRRASRRGMDCRPHRPCAHGRTDGRPARRSHRAPARHRRVRRARARARARAALTCNAVAGRRIGSGRHRTGDRQRRPRPC